MNKNLVRQFNFWRILGIVALVCTILLTVILCAESLKPGEESSASSGAVSDTIKDNVSIRDNERTYPLTGIICHQTNMSATQDAQMNLTFTYTPQKATDKRLTFSSDNPDVVSVDDSGVLTYNSYGTANITATSVADPNVTTTFNVFCTGLAVNDIPDDLYLSSYYSSEPCNEIPQCEYSYIYLRDGAGNIVSVNNFNISSKNLSVLTVDEYLHFVALKPGDATITLTHKKTGKTKDITVTVIEGTPPPTKFNFKEETVYLYKNQKFDVRDNVTAEYPTNRFAKYSCSDLSLFLRSCYEFTAIKVGEATFTVTPYAEDGIVTTFHVIVTEPTPTQLTIIGNDRIVRDAKYTYTVFDGERECDNISWSVVKGDAIITDDGKLVANELGNVVIRATSTLDGTVYAELTVCVSLFESFSTFVRKVFGHFSAFAVLGFGFAVTYFLLIGKLRKYSPLFALASGVVVASITEILQLPIFTANRGPSVKDVLLDSTGVLCGIVIAVALMCLVLSLIKLISPHKYNSTKICIGKLSFKTAFLSAKLTRALFDDVDTSTTTTIANSTTDKPTIVDDTTTTVTESLD